MSQTSGAGTRERTSASGQGALAKFQAPEIVFGPGALSEAGFAAGRLGARRPLIVTDQGIHEAGWVATLQTHLRESGLTPITFTGITPNPKEHEVEAAYRAYLEHGCDVVIGLGGGSAMDAAKAVAILAGNGGSILDYRGVDQVRRSIPPMLMIPTTSGTGADVSQFCIVTDTTRHVKVTILGRALVPDISITDPRLLHTMPDWLNAATGLDALTHGIEAFVSRAHHPLTDVHALESVGLVDTHLERTITSPDDAEARTGMAQASLNAGLAFTNAILGATHAMSHQVGGLLDAPHGVINGILLPHVIRFNAEDAPDRFVAIAHRFGIDVAGLPAPVVAELLADRVRRLADEVGVPSSLRALGIQESHLSVLASNSLDDACITTNPRASQHEDIERIFRAAL
ncbi:iron-containing alcohol dehydrogenase [Dermacoccaceae bacterium W4C1]